MIYILYLMIFIIHSSIHGIEPIKINTIYGDALITEPILIELIESDAIERLKKINQYGIMKFIKPEEVYTRYQHSIGVLYLLRRFGASLEEQVMGLLHDVSHTAFSHVADFLFDTVQNKYSYQDSIFGWYVQHTDLEAILAKYNLSWIGTPEALSAFTMLKSDIPNLCADRLEYNLYGGYLEGLLTKADIDTIINALRYEDSRWIFNNIKTARLFADVALTLCTNIWCADWNCFIYSETAKLLKRACELSLITIDELSFSDDATVWTKLINYNDPIIKQQIARILDYKTQFTHGSKEMHDYTTQGKFRWIDPFVNTADSIVRLSTLDMQFKNSIETMREHCKEPHYIKYLPLPTGD
jgi:uncharacterized protein